MITLAAAHAPAYDQVVTGVLGFLVVAAMGIALYFLLRSMNKQLRKVTREPRWREDAQAGQPAQAAQAEPEQDFSRNGTPQA